MADAIDAIVVPERAGPRHEHPVHATDQRPQARPRSQDPSTGSVDSNGMLMTPGGIRRRHGLSTTDIVYELIHGVLIVSPSTCRVANAIPTTNSATCSASTRRPIRKGRSLDTTLSEQYVYLPTAAAGPTASSGRVWAGCRIPRRTSPRSSSSSSRSRPRIASATTRKSDGSISALGVGNTGSSTASGGR